MSAFTLITQAIAGAIAARGAKKSAAQNQAGQEDAAKYALDNSMPWDVTGSLGGAKFDRDGKMIGLGLSEDFARQQEGFLGAADRNRGYLNEYAGNADANAQKYYDRGMELRGPEQEAAREALDAQLAARGMLGSTGGMGQAMGLADSQGTTNLQARMSAEDRVQGLIDTYRGRIQGDVSNAAELGKMPLAYAQLGVKTGGMLSNAAIMGSRFLSGASLTNANSTAGRYGGFANAVSNFKQPYTGSGSGSYLSQAAKVDAKTKAMGVPSVINYNSGTKYGFGL